jgi:hypothetical protein
MQHTERANRFFQFHGGIACNIELKSGASLSWTKKLGKNLTSFISLAKLYAAACNA